MTRPDELRIETGASGHRAETHLLINGIDVLDLHQASGDAPPSRRTLPYLPADPLGLLPPDSRALLPTGAPTPVMIGICTCGEPGCGSLWMQVCRRGAEVIWEPTTQTLRGSVRHSWRFDLVAYLDAVDAAAGPWGWENRARRLARELRFWRDSLFGGSLGHGGQLISARAWPGLDHIDAGVVGATGMRFLRLPIDPQDSCDDVLRRLHAESLLPTTET